MTAIILSTLLFFGVASANESPPPWAILVYDCNRPVGIMLNMDPPRWFPASGAMTPYVAAQIDISINAKRVARLNVGRNCADRKST